MELNLSYPGKTSNYKFKPEDEVFVPFLFSEDLEIMYRRAYSTTQEAKIGCFWFREKNKDKKVLKRMIAKDFVHKCLKIGGMNSFESLNMIETFSKMVEKNSAWNQE